MSKIDHRQTDRHLTPERDADREDAGAPGSDQTSGPLIDLTITSVAYGGKGVARQEQDLPIDENPSLSTAAATDSADEDSSAAATGGSRNGKVWFVEGAVTGDKVRARVTADEGRYGEAHMVELLEPSPLRQTALCPYERQCGGCQWMGIGYDQQLTWKKGFVETALRRIGKLKSEVPVTIIPSPTPFQYRNRVLVRAHWHPDVDGPAGESVPGRFDVGYFARGSRRLVPIKRCEIAAEGLNQLILDLQGFRFPEAPAFKARLEMQEIRGTADHTGQGKSLVVTVYPAEGPREAMEALVTQLKTLSYVTWAGLVFELSSAPLVDFDHDLDRDFFTIPGQFQQINMGLNRTLRRLVKDKVEQEKPARILDVFCGSGNLTLPLADGTRYVEAIEFNKKAIVCAHRNAERNNLKNVCFLAGDAEKHLWKVARGGETFDLVILDPPRQGMYKGMVPLKNLAPKHIIYVSCDPTTLARDLGYLLRKDFYTIESVTALDFFPNTYHVETVVFLRRSAGRDHTQETQDRS